MSKEQKTNIPASILQRLKNYSQARKEDRGLTISNYAIERFLYRLSLSPYAGQFVLKGAQLFRIWAGNDYRPTRDVDLLRFGSPDIPELERIFREVCQIQPDDQDGIVFIAESVKGEEIREDNEYDGVRIKLEFRIGRTGEHMQIDIGFGDAVNPPAQEIVFPSILKMSAPKLRAYSHETVVAEKVEAMVSLGYANSRMKDFYDVYQLSNRFDFDGELLAGTIRATFQRRGTGIPDELPVAFTKDFYDDPVKITQWNAFIRRNALEDIKLSLVVEAIRKFIAPIFKAIKNSQSFSLSWKTNEGWI
jgi:predicted nucleotidyltransferase component of viral defense system